MTLKFKHVSELWMDAAKEMLDPPGGTGLHWWPRMSHRIGGLRPHELTLFCAPTGAGKTQFLANISAQMLEAGIGHFVAPVETGDVDYLIRVLSCLEGQRFNNGDPVPGDRVEALTQKYLRLIQESPLYISTYDNRVEIDEMINTLKFMSQAHGVQVALLDNLNFFLKVTSSQMEKAEMDSAIHEFTILAKQLPMHVILIVHPRKTEGGRVESEFDIKGSSTAVQEASNVALYNRPKPEDVECGKRDITDRELVFKKLRKRGEEINKPIWFKYEGGKMRERE